MPVTEIQQYEVMYSANQFVPRIWLKNGGRFIGQLIFRPNGAQLPPDGMTGAQVNLYYHLDNYAHVIDLLRNEAPVYLHYSGSGGGNENGVKTSAELVGEGES